MFAHYYRSQLALAITAIAIASTAALAAPPVNDNASTPTAISGTGLFNFDLTQATTSAEGQDWCGGVANDIWFCWTPTCSGMATIQTCGLTNVNTKIFYYIGCGVPSLPPSPSPFCCDDDGCGNPQSSVVCETYCGQPMMIRIGCKPGTPPGTGQFSITCNGNPCQTCEDCCGKKPKFLSQTVGGFTGGAAVLTQQAGINNRVVDYIDISSQPPTGSMVNWYAPFFTPSGPQDWSQSNLGTVFGVTLDDLGNTYLAHASCYGNPSMGPGDAVGTITGGAAGAIYKIDTNTGIPSVFAVLPNALITGCTTAPDCYPGLGNICFSCQHQMLYVTNHEDGRIYRLNMSGVVQSTWRHSTGTMLVGAPPPDPNGFSPLTPHPGTGRGQRVWAVRVGRGRLYYSVWREDSGRPSGTFANEIWSVNLFPNGEFWTGTEQLELVMPGFNAQGFSNPVSDISFRPNTCCMLLAERTMLDDTTSYAHSSRLLEYCKVNNTWVPSGSNFTVGNPSIPDSAAGGCDYDFATGAGINVNVWATGDAIKFANTPPPDPFIYGLGGMTFAGTNPYTNGLMIDSNQSTGSVDKFQQGDVEITCPEPVVPTCSYDPLTRQCTQCPTPGTVCGPTKVIKNAVGQYEIAECDCLPDGHCRIQYNGPDVPPTCIDPCPVPPGGTCAPNTQSNADGTVAFTCGCVQDPPFCQVVNIPDPTNPGATTSACAGPCPNGTPCTPIEIREFPAGSGNFTVTQCSCDPQPCHPRVVEGHVVCEGTCPTPIGGMCNVVAIPEPPNPDGTPGGILYHCICDCKKPPQNMVDWWPMNALSPVKDRVNWLNNGTPIGGVSVATAANSCVGQGMVFNGSNGYVTVPNAGASSADINFGVGNFTLEGWVKTNVQGYQPVVDKRGGVFPNVVGYAFFLWSGGQIGFQMGSPPFANFFTSGFNVSDGQCHHIAAVVKRGNPNQIRLYVDGVFQSFTNSTVVGSVNNTVPLLFGREYVFSGGSPVHFNGLLDDWEFYKRALTDQEIKDLYNARTFGKCCDTCYTPAVVFCANENSKKVCIQICNYCDQDASFNWSLSGPTGGPGCAATGPMTFTPSSGSTGPVPPGQCRTICVNLTLPAGIPIPPPIVTGCYQLAVTNTTTGRQFTCSNTVSRTRDLCFLCNPPCPIPVVVTGTTRDFSMAVTNQSSSASSTVDYRWTVRYPNSENAPDAQAVSLNGLPPGEPVIGTLSLAPGGTTQLPIAVTVLENEQFQPIEIKLEADTDGDGVPDPVEAISVKTSNCAVGVVGDMNEDGATTSADVPSFVAALRGTPAKVYDVVLADTNCDGVLNGKDIQLMVNALLTGP